MIGSNVEGNQIGGLVRVKAHTRQDPKRKRQYASLKKLHAVIRTGRAKRRRRLRAVGSGLMLY